MQGPSLKLSQHTTAADVQRFLKAAGSHDTLRARTEGGATILYTAGKLQAAQSLGALSIGVGQKDFEQSTAARDALDTLFGSTTFSARPGPLKVTRALQLLDAQLLLASLTGGADGDTQAGSAAHAQASVDVFLFDSDSDGSDGPGLERKSSQSRSSISSDSMAPQQRTASGSLGAAQDGDIAPEAPKPDILDASQFKSLSKAAGVGVGGQTGSKRYLLELPGGHTTYAQVKWPCDSLRALGKGGPHAENLRELFGARMVRAMNAQLAQKLPPGERVVQESLVPKVSLIREEGHPQLRIASQFLSPKGNAKLQEHAIDSGVQGKGEKARVRVALNNPHAAPQPATAASTSSRGPAVAGPPPDVFVIRDDRLIRDICLNTALSIAALDHDLNHGNEVIVEVASDSAEGERKAGGIDAPGGGSQPVRIGRIDFGHAFGDMLMGPRGFGGGFKAGSNLALDFINRETVANTSPGGSPSKLWRDFIGLVPRKELAQALREVAGSPAAATGLHEAGEQLRLIARDLVCHPRDHSAKDKAKRDESEDIADSLASISNKLGMAVDRDQPLELIVNQVERNLVKFMARHQKDMEHVADLCELQASIDELIALRAGGGDKVSQDALSGQVDRLYAKVAAGKKSVTWLKVVAQEPAFQGDLQAYIQHRTQRARPMAL